METIKRCSKCKQFKQLSKFNKSKSEKDGLQSYCKTCQRVYSHSKNGREACRKAANNYRKTTKGKATKKRFYKRHPNYEKANHAVNNAITSGRLPRPDTMKCNYCPKQAQQYHHWHGYEPERWLDVIPICMNCHYKRRRRIA